MEGGGGWQANESNVLNIVPVCLFLYHYILLHVVSFAGSEFFTADS